MKEITSVIESAKATAYELLATLLPGIVFVRAICALLDRPMPSSSLELAILAYVVGTVLQGVANWFAKRGPIAKWLNSGAGAAESRALAAKLIRARLGDDVPDAALFDVCLSRIEGRRQVYDKFIALRDMARALVFSLIVWAAVAARDLWPATWRDAWKLGAVLAALAIATLALIERWRRFHPLPTQVVFGQFFASWLDDDHAPKRPSEGAAASKEAHGEGE